MKIQLQIKDNSDKYNQEICTFQSVMNFVQGRIDIVYGFDDYKNELSNLEDVKFYLQMKIDILMEKYCKGKKTLYKS